MSKLDICTDREDVINDYDYAVKLLHATDDVFPQLKRESACIDALVTQYLLQQKLQYLNKNYPETKFLQQYYSGEAWSVTDAIGKTLDKMKNFFTRTIQYIKVFAVMRIGAAEVIIKRWASICDEKREEVEQYLKKNDKKEMSVASLTELMNVAQVLYKEFQDQFTKISHMTVDNAVTGNNADELAKNPSRYDDWLKLLEKVENENPRNKTTQGKAAVSLIDGKWGDSVELIRLSKATAQARVVMGDLNRLKANADKIISDLSHSDNTPPPQKTDNDAGKMKVQSEDILNRRKLAYLNKFSKEAMTKLIGTFTTYTSFCGNQCEQFTKAFDKTATKVAKVENK